MRIINLHKFFQFLFLLLAVSLTVSCVKIIDTGWDPQAYTVKKGETLYSIAWRYEKDFRDIAKWNGIRSPFNIYPGQRLNMVAANASGTMDDQQKPVIDKSDEPFELPRVVVRRLDKSVESNPVPLKQRPKTFVVRKGDTLYSIARYQGLNHKLLARWNALSAPYAIYPGKTLKLRPPAASSKVKTHRASRGKKTAATANSARVVSKPLPKRVKAWQWPAKGKLVKTFNARDTSRKGIGIAGNRGQSIRAAAGGKVVYSGNGLIHYGNLVIIKHSNSFLSAYAHNRSLLVKEGDQVKVGQTIAQMGTIENGRARLHFEIRKSGKPVNPLRYLPKRKG